MTSVYPIDTDTLTEKVKALAIELGELPSRNRIKTEFRVGAPKATAALTALTAAGFDPTHPEQAGPDTTSRRLHAVPTTDPADTAPTEPLPVVDPDPTPVPVVEATPADTDVTADPAPAGVEVSGTADPDPVDPPAAVESDPAAVGAGVGQPRPWPLLLLAVGAFVAIWGGWVGLGELTGFGPIRLLPGIADSFVINSAITLPIGVEAYAAYALRVWLSGGTRSATARRFARVSAIGSLVLGAAGQVAYHLMVAAGVTAAPWWITTFVSCLPVVVLGCGAALTHLLHNQHNPVEVTR